MTMKKFLIALLLTLILALPVSVPAVSPQNPKGFEGKAYDATMALYATTGDKTEFVCTIWNYKQMDGGYDLISAGHCVGDVHGDSYSVSDTLGSPRTPVTLVKWLDAAGYDFSLWELKTTKKYPTLDLGSLADACIGDEVINPNFALGLTKFLSLGRISGPVVPADDSDSVSVYPVEVDGAGGSSGSPIIDKRTHKVIGILIYSPPFDPIPGQLGVPVPARVGTGVEPIDNFNEFLNGMPLPKVVSVVPPKQRGPEKHPFIPGL
jgi:Trypsin-like peptidase domain